MLRAISRKMLPRKVKDGLKRHALPVFWANRQSSFDRARSQHLAQAAAFPARKLRLPKDLHLATIPSLNTSRQTRAEMGFTNGGIRYFCQFLSSPFSKVHWARVNVLEIGIYGGGSLGMWQNYAWFAVQDLRRGISSRCARSMKATGPSARPGGSIKRVNFGDLHCTSTRPRKPLD